jgi:hypothetical protein
MKNITPKQPAAPSNAVDQWLKRNQRDGAERLKCTRVKRRQCRGQHGQDEVLDLDRPTGADEDTDEDAEVVDRGHDNDRRAQRWEEVIC